MQPKKFVASQGGQTVGSSVSRKSSKTMSWRLADTGLATRNRAMQIGPGSSLHET